MKAAWTLRHSGAWTVSTGELTLYGLRDLASQVPGGRYTTCASFGRRSTFRVFFRRDEVERASERAEELIADGGRTSQFVAAAVALETRLRHFWRDVDWDDATSNRGLAEIYERGNGLLAELLAYYQLSNSDLDGSWLTRVRGYCQRAFNARDTLQCLLAADVRSLDTHQERVAWLRLCERRLADGPVVHEEHAVQNHAREYQHVLHGPGQSGGVVPLLRSRLDGIDAQACDALRAHVRCSTWISETAEHRACVCAGGLGLPDDLFRACRSVAQLSVARLSQRESLQFSYLRRDRLLKAIHRRIVGPDDAPLVAELTPHLSNEEILEALHEGRGPDVSQLRMRRQACLMELTAGRVLVWGGAEAERRRRWLGLPPVDAPRPGGRLVGTSVAGLRAGVGRAQVMKKADPANLTARQVRGRVVVTEMIRPYMVPLLREAAAIVTEEGGVASHAAVLARELRLPCVVGVHGATRILHTGTPLFVSVRTGSVYVVSPKRFSRLRPSPRRRATRRNARTLIPELDRSLPDIVPLSSSGRYGPNAVGGKAANLAHIHHLTPRGFIVTTAGVKHLSPSPGGDHDRVQRTLAAALADLGATRLAVRSSHPWEDSAVGSYAGLFKTVLSVPTDECMSAVRQVASSVSPNHLAGYGAVGPLPPPAVVVQELVEPVLSGVALSSLRRRGRDWLVLEYVIGGLERLSNGSLTPLCSALDRSCRPACKVGLVPPVPEGMVPIGAVERLVEIVMALERDREYPQEIEWGIDATGRLWLFQIRPITAGLDDARARK